MEKELEERKRKGGKEGVGEKGREQRKERRKRICDVRRQGTLGK